MTLGTDRKRHLLKRFPCYQHTYPKGVSVHLRDHMPDLYYKVPIARSPIRVVVSIGDFSRGPTLPRCRTTCTSTFSDTSVMCSTMTARVWTTTTVCWIAAATWQSVFSPATNAAEPNPCPTAQMDSSAFLLRACYPWSGTALWPTRTWRVARLSRTFIVLSSKSMSRRRASLSSWTRLRHIH
jgi:hypothetical protein